MPQPATFSSRLAWPRGSAHTPAVASGYRNFMLGVAVLLQGELGFFCAFGQPLEAADNPPAENAFVCRAWQVEHGLPQNSVLAMVQTKDGYLWIGTANGLARFDGVGFKRFGLADGLPSLLVRVLVEDQDGALWIGTGNGLSRFCQGKFTNWTTRDGLPGDGIMALDLASDGTLWVGTTAGLCRFRNHNFDAPGLPSNLAHSYVRALLADRTGAVWVSMPEQGLLRWDGHTFAAVTNLPSAQTMPPYRLLQDRAGRIWCGMATVFCLQTNGTWKSYGPNEGLPGVRITALTEGADGTLWVGTLDEGLYYFRAGRFHRVTQPDGLSDEAVQAVLEDREQNVWVGTRVGGLNRLKPRQLSMWSVLEGQTEISPLSLAEAADGTLWVAAPGRGFYQSGARQAGRFARSDLVNRPPFGALLITRDGSLWWGTASSLRQWQNGWLLAAYQDEPWLRSDAVRCLCEDQQDGLWVGTRDGQLMRLRHGKFTAFTSGVPRGALTALAQARDGTLWIGSYGGGLGRLAATGGTVLGRAQGLASDLIRTLHLDSSDRLWIGTEGGGLGCLSDGTIRTFTSKHGLGDDTIVQLLEDNAGNLWLGTFHGIHQILRHDLDELLAGRRTRLQPRVFGQSDGMRSEQCAVGFGTCLKTRDGRLCFSTDRGIAVLGPQVRQDSGAPPVVRLETVLVEAEAQPLLAHALASGKPEPQTLVVPAGKRRLEFRFAGLYFSAPERVCYRYQLQGLDSDWVEAGYARTAYYSFVPPGTYRFRVTSHNGNGAWSETDVVLPLIVLPHFWETWWFRLTAWLGGAALASGAVLAVLRRRLQWRMQALERQRAVERERARIAQDMHDELGSRLTKAGMVAGTLARKLDGASLPQDGLQTLRRTLEEMTVTMDELVWAVNPQHDTLDGLANYVIRFTQEFFAGTSIRCVLNLPADLPAVPLTAAVRHNLFLAFKEALTNAAKHAQPIEVTVSVEFFAGWLRLVLEDNGSGFTFTDRRAGGRGLENIRNRLNAIGGRCDVESALGRGTRVQLEVPLQENPMFMGMAPLSKACFHESKIEKRGRNH